MEFTGYVNTAIDGNTYVLDGTLTTAKHPGNIQAGTIIPVNISSGLRLKIFTDF